ncbi:hypothetical protein M758_8G141700 [Ceratodon purpureus]|uniref:Uncharacterized protein n=1 Tax=Ceratodon purpureus TaxID=3225 RepID=A0A8T0GYY0_CERPU|nr:hypothetical protein KC19_8G145400 [Ceratodon purpureus]KAG0608900.1 hypothetical protein M758_8G141700 [Ceratodon purpureus]
MLPGPRPSRLARVLLLLLATKPMDIVIPRLVSMHKVSFNAKSEYEMILNSKVLQQRLQKTPDRLSN